MRQKLSVIIIAYNEEHNIGRCLESVKWADEIVVIDSESTDATAKICREYTDKIFCRAFDDFAAQKNYALAHATGPWILSLDADEQLSIELQKEIEEILVSSSYPAYLLKRRNFVYGAFLHYAPNDYHVRLFKKEGASFVSPIHEYVVLQGEKGRLENVFWHYTMPTISHHVKKIDSYTDAYLKKYPSLRITSLNAIWYLGLRPFLKFLQHYGVRGAWKDGMRGLIFSINTIAAESLIYMKVWERQVMTGKMKKDSEGKAGKKV